MSLTQSQIDILKANAAIIVAPSVPYAAGGIQSIRPYTEGGRWNFTRTTTKTIRKTSGIVRMPIRTPSVDKDGQLVLEPARTNVVFNSEDLTAWGPFGLAPTIVANAGIAPDGQQTADSVTFANPLGPSIIRRTGISLASSTTYSFSYFVKNVNLTGSQTIRLSINNNQGAPSEFLFVVAFNFASKLATTQFIGTAGTGYVNGSGSAAVEELQDGWFRITATATTGSSAASSACSYEFSCNVTAGNVFLWGAQMEAAAWSSTYIRTDNSAVTRATEEATITRLMAGTGDFTLFLHAKIRYIPGGDQGIFAVHNAAGTLQFYARCNNGVLAFFHQGFGGFGMLPNFAITNNTYFKLCLRRQSGSFIHFFNGVKGTVGYNQLGVIDLSTFGFQNSGIFGGEWTGRHIDTFAVINSALADAMAIALTQ